MPNSPTPTVMTGTVDLDAIEARARAATSGTWTALRDDYENDGASDHRIACPSTEELFYIGDYQNAGADAAHIAGMDPPTTLALVATIRALETERDAMREALEMIAGVRQCFDNLMNNQEIAAAALVHPMAETEKP